uniref:Protein LOW PSII ACCUMULATION 3ic-like isoform X3 n=2 Tax=Rhizophora mucronata TaxID=61149 RepID=A0A2P2KXJ7_RHIMU
MMLPFLSLMLSATAKPASKLISRPCPATFLLIRDLQMNSLMPIFNLPWQLSRSSKRKRKQELALFFLINQKCAGLLNFSKQLLTW